MPGDDAAISHFTQALAHQNQPEVRDLTSAQFHSVPLATLNHPATGRRQTFMSVSANPIFLNYLQQIFMELNLNEDQLSMINNSIESLISDGVLMPSAFQSL